MQDRLLVLNEHVRMFNWLSNLNGLSTGTIACIYIYLQSSFATYLLGHPRATDCKPLFLPNHHHPSNGVCVARQSHLGLHLTSWGIFHFYDHHLKLSSAQASTSLSLWRHRSRIGSIGKTGLPISSPSRSLRCSWWRLGRRTMPHVFFHDTSACSRRLLSAAYRTSGTSVVFSLVMTILINEGSSMHINVRLRNITRTRSLWFQGPYTRSPVFTTASSFSSHSLTTQRTFPIVFSRMIMAFFARIPTKITRNLGHAFASSWIWTFALSTSALSICL